jgi:hypothetical protein
MALILQVTAIINKKILVLSLRRLPMHAIADDYCISSKASERLNVLKIAVLCTQYMILTTCASTGSYVWAAGLHLTALACLPVWWGVRMAHKQRLAALTGLSKYDGRAGRAAVWIDVACTVGTGFSIAWFLLGSAPPEKVYDGVLAGQDVLHLTITVLVFAAYIAYGLITCFG